jgi:hypothetical protein
MASNDTSKFRGKNKLSHDLYLPLLENHLRKYCEFLCATAFAFKQPWHFKKVLLWCGLVTQSLKQISGSMEG